MADIATITGVKEIIRNLKRRNAQMEAGLVRGLKLAGLTLQRESQRLVPVNVGKLKASAFTRSSGSGWRTVVTVGYTASYAIFVHEAVGMVLKGQPRTGKGNKGYYWDPQGRAQAKFLEEPARRLGPQLRAIIREHSRIRGI